MLVFLHKIYIAAYALYAHNHTTTFKGVTGETLYWLMWEAVRRLEEIGLKVHNTQLFTYKP